MTEWKAQIGGGHYSIQFETTDRDLYKLVQKACQEAIDKEDKKPIKSLNLCNSCYYGDGNPGCSGNLCSDCEMSPPDEKGFRCKCLITNFGEPCSDYRPMEREE